ncbi:hypothetical protein TOPH_05512 [Tolypocladium ophioglossoides CBS 100239]|uniref:DUF3669 domain-containing protein n=1 Tax=Tolypocladium ophioglossoides (strain CBS 100239) TaxID=1163406 RepID=A0A0L0N7B1_TOLOC|nr:hypothetical protein TOPH_05512 [Tolypocladium ophioglossoides CBS 100239]
MASQRVQNNTGESKQSAASSLLRNARLAFQYLATELENLSGDIILRLSLTTKSVIFTTSSFATLSQRAASRPELQHIQQIGEGLQGAIFEQVGQALVMKKEKPGNENVASNLRHEYSLHSRVVAAFDRYAMSVGSEVLVPRLFGIILPSDTAFWQVNLHKFPEGYRSCTAVIQMGRILPLPKVIRRALVTQLYPYKDAVVDLEMTRSILHSPPNKHCLARTYLGRKDGYLTQEKFTLRNIPLYLKSMERFGLDTQSLAASMGKAYAIMHWGACINGDDIEFVLGSSAVRTQEQRLQHRAVHLFLLDFGQCEAVDLSGDVAAVYQAFKGAMVTGDNQLFIPHCKKSAQLFGAFRKALS